jgi:hypothetical protein
MSLGIISFSDSKYFDHFRFFAKSFQKFHDLPIILFYDYLSREQTAWCYKYDILIKKITGQKLFPNISYLSESLDKTTYKVGWRAILKPYCFMRSPFDKTFWMDSDMFVIRPLYELFDKLNNGPVLSSETCCGSRYPKGFLELLPEKIKENKNKHINSGLIGLNLNRDIDCDILYTWTNIINYAENCEHLKQKSFLNNMDQKYLLWVIEKLQIFQYIMSNIESSRYNHSPNPRPQFNSTNLNDLIEETKKTYDRRMIHHNTVPHCLHFFGSDKLPELCKNFKENV